MGNYVAFVLCRIVWGFACDLLGPVGIPPPKESSPPAEAPSPVVSDAESPLNSAVEPAASHSSIEPSTDGVFFKKFCYAARVLLSLLFLCFAMVTSGAALTAGWTTMWTGVAPHSSALLPWKNTKFRIMGMLSLNICQPHVLMQFLYLPENSRKASNNGRNNGRRLMFKRGIS